MVSELPFSRLKWEPETWAWKAQHPAKRLAQSGHLPSSVSPVSHRPHLRLQDPGPCGFTFPLVTTQGGRIRGGWGHLLCSDSQI